ncbi:segregation/condensation protein A [Streptomyces sp. NBC_01799]|uniref:segregation and condensation protein A n=1 Tax=Streptomyces sp. NBC_01800 TaxID=2975945 RepID=UPI002DD97090|nr:segregation/condensation protein A [Streptomyces sp. NBC_01800]WSA67367.1 segregation/condensation protein A [Streptomyces sp. NBC_01800]WSA75957.1 segregation/condensation protein A [Streptomyces sp. NBC_01799]
MPTTDEPARTPRRPLGRGPGGRPAPSAAGAAVVAGDAVGVSPTPPLPGTGEASPDPSTAVTDAPAADAVAPADTAGPAVPADTGGPVLPVGAADTVAATGPAARAGTDAVAAPAAPADTDAVAPADTAGPVAPADPADTAASGAPADDGRFTVRLANFEGPFDLLLQLISRHKLDVTEVALSKVTDEFMAHIRAMGVDWDLDQTTEFLVVAATLLDLKAARLLPAAEVEDEADLALLEARDLLFARLLQYRAYKRIAEIFSARLESEGRRFPRTVGLEPHHAELLPEVVISIGAEGFARLAVKAMQPKPKPQVYVDHIHAPLVSVREQAEIVVARLREAGEITFRALTEDAPDTLTVVARFLALLELYREKAVTLDQEEALGELMVRWAGGEAAEPAVTDEFDQEVQDMDVQEDVQA